MYFCTGNSLSECEKLLLHVQSQNLLGAYEPRCTATGDFEAMQCRPSSGKTDMIHLYILQNFKVIKSLSVFLNILSTFKVNFIVLKSIHT